MGEQGSLYAMFLCHASMPFQAIHSRQHLKPSSSLLTLNSVCHIEKIIRGVQVNFRGTTRNNVLAKVDVAKEELP